MRMLRLLSLGLALCFLLSACQSRKIDNTMIVDPGGPVSYAQDIQPIFSSSCGGAGCHVNQSVNGVELTNYAQVMSSIGVQYGADIVVPGNPDASPLVDKIESDPQFGVRMPQNRAPLSAQEISLIRTWIAEGAANN